MDRVEIEHQWRGLLRDSSDLGIARLVRFRMALGPEGKRDLELADVVGEAWRAVLEDASLAPEMLAALERSGALAGEVGPRTRIHAEDLVTALGEHRFGPAKPVLTALWTNPEAMREMRGRAGHALMAFGDPGSLDALIGRLDTATGTALSLALQALFTRSPSAAFDVIAPLVSEPTERAGVLLECALHTLMMDLQDDGKAHWGKSRGWFAADPRWLALCESWQKLPPPKVRALWGKKPAQAIFEIAALLRKGSKREA